MKLDLQASVAVRSCMGLFAATVLAMLTACGGGGGDSGSPPFGGGGTVKAADLSLVLDKSSIKNTGSETVKATVTAVDSNRNAVSGIPVTLKVDESATVAVSATATDSSGSVAGTVGIGANRSNRVITITATSGDLVRKASFQVTGAKLTATGLPNVVVGSVNTIQYRLVDDNDVAMAGESITVTAAGVPDVTGVIDSKGKFDYSYTAPAAAGDLAIEAIAAGVPLTQTIAVAAAGGAVVPPASQVPVSASVETSPSVVSVNVAGNDTNQAEVRALFVGIGNAPIANMRVRFDLENNSNSSDADVVWTGGDYAYSNSTGIARATLIPRLRSSPTNGVKIRACYATTDFPVGACPQSVSTTLTITSEALAVSIRTNELIESGIANLTYIKKFVVMVVDSAGVAKPDVQITPSIDLPNYYKGYYVYNGETWNQVLTLDPDQGYAWNPATPAWTLVAPPQGPLPGSTVIGPQVACPNEDVNRNGVREANAYDPGVTSPALAARKEDLNWNGELDARKSDVAIRMVGASKTDESGLAIVQIEYGKDLATWVDFTITVTAGGVSGTEARAKYVGNRYGNGSLPAPIDAITAEGAPAFNVSPYGRARACTDKN